MVTPQAGQIGGRSSGSVTGSRRERQLSELRDRDSNPNFLIQSQASYH